jgi:hypothetical protein
MEPTVGPEFLFSNNTNTFVDLEGVLATDQTPTQTSTAPAATTSSSPFSLSRWSSWLFTEEQTETPVEEEEERPLL